MYPRNNPFAVPIGDMEQEEDKREKFGDGSERVIAALIEVHRTLGPGLLESAYEACFCRELHLRGLRFERQRPLPVEYKGLLVDCGYRLDVVVEARVLIELKAVERLLPIHQAQVVTYLKLSRLDVGLLVNFNVQLLKHGLRRLWLSDPTFSSPSPSCSIQRSGEGTRRTMDGQTSGGRN